MASNEEASEVVSEPSSSLPSLEDRPGILIIGPSAVGKRTLLSRLLSLDLEDDSDSDSQLLIRGWTIDTKYYSADVSVWVTHLTDGFRIENLPCLRRLAAVVMVFDATELSSLVAVQEWVSRTDIHDFEILLCVGNKVDLVPGHPVHQEYRRRLLRQQQKLEVEQSASDEFGISETEGANLLGDNEDEDEDEVVEEEAQSAQIRRSCLEWCTERNIEYIEACASNPEFDKCLSVDGDSQGMERIFGALSAHMWPGMVLRSGNKMAEEPLPDEEEFSEESDYELEYEVLSAGSAEPWDDTRWVSATPTPNEGESSAAEKRDVAGVSNGNKESSSITSNTGESVMGTCPENGEKSSEMSLQLLSTRTGESSEDFKGAVQNAEEVSDAKDVVEPFEFEDLEKLMFEIGNIRDGLRLMPDVQRREMAANLAMKMASMFGGGSDDEKPDQFD